MSSPSTSRARPRLADLLERLGDISPRRILMDPLPGTATEADLLRTVDDKDPLCELVEGTLVEKVMGAPEANVAGWILRLLGYHVDPNNLGELIPGDGPVRLMAGLVRLPDVTFIRREKLPGGRLPSVAVPDLVPDLAVEVLSEGNTAGEMQRKRKEYFLAGTTLVWIVDPRRRVVTVYTAPEVGRTFTEGDTLDGGTVLPGLALPVQRIFERLPPNEPSTPTRRSRKKKPPK
jgi:Uma2 family endonuclease